MNGCTSDGRVAVWLEDGYTGGLRNIERGWCCGEACEWVGEFCIDWTKKKNERCTN